MTGAERGGSSPSVGASAQPSIRAEVVSRSPKLPRLLVDPAVGVQTDQGITLVQLGEDFLE